MNRLIVSDGTSQSMRALPALQEGYFRLDEMSFPELLSLATEFSALVQFINAQDSPEGSWQPFFQTDETIVMSRILAFDLSAATAGFERWWQDTPESERAGEALLHWDLHALPLTALIQTIDDWYGALIEARSENAIALRAVIERMIVQLRVNRSGTLQRLLQAQSGVQLAPLWSQAQDTVASTQTEDDKEDTPATARAELTKSAIRADCSACAKAIEMIRREALARLPASLRSQDHDPACGLLIAFIQQFQQLKTKMNRFTERYLDFYYDRMLGCTPLPMVPDRTWLVFRKNPGTPAVQVLAQTPFLAGLDERSQDISYLARNDLWITDVNVTQLQTLYFDHNRYSEPENRMPDERADASAERTWPTAAWFKDLQVQPVAAGVRLASPHPVLGAIKSGVQQESPEDARIGFALASKVLLLKEGQRKVTVTIRFEDTLLAQRLEQLVPAMHDDDDDAPAALQEIRRQDAFLKVFRRIFTIDITGEHGWLEIADYLPTHTERELTLQFELPPQAPAVVAFDPILHGTQLQAGTPVLRFFINPAAYLYPYGMLRELKLRDTRIDVEVSGCRDLVLHNNIGQLSASAPFAPFGPLPRVGSYLLVGSSEMAGKQIAAARVDIEWADQPRLNGGFPSHYGQYPSAPANDDFMVSATVLGKGNWLPAAEQDRPMLPMFEARLQPGQGEYLSSRMSWNCTSIAHLFEAQDGIDATRPLAYSPAATNGFFKFTLAAPSMAFGHELYPGLLSAALVANSRRKRLSRQMPLPRAPYTPQISSISLAYQASSIIRIDRRLVGQTAQQEQFLHLYPSGWERLDLGSYPTPALLPRFDFSGNLYIGLDRPALGETLTLLFQLREDSLPLPPPRAQRPQHGVAPGLHWFYLADNVWKPLPRRALVADGTQNFMTSGIVTLNLPADISAGNTVMASDCCWLRVSADYDLEKYCSLVAVYAQALEVRRSPEVSAQVPMQLPAAAISRSKIPLPGVTAIFQPLASVGGRPGETRAQLRVRVSERLRHKNRAISAADYESLILQYFPDVYKVKCFANLCTDRGPTDCIRPGHVLIVPVPYWPAHRQREQMPLLNGNLMREIREFLETLSSPWSRISVENPVYERIQVRCKVKFRNGQGMGQQLNELNREISRFLTPWQEGRGYRTHFGWCIRQHDIEAYIGELPYVEHVSGFSMLRVSSPDTRSFSLLDSAGTENGAAISSEITPLCPWSIAIPAASHVIDVIGDNAQYPPRRTALGRLAIGSTFIISPDDHDQKNNDAA